MHWTDAVAVYHPQEPKASPLWRLLDEHFPAFPAEYDDRFLREYGFLRSVIPDGVEAFRQCGDLSEGFVRVRCPDCHHEYLLAFSCRGRRFCPSCHARKVILFGRHLRDNVLYPVPHRQYVFSNSIILRRFFMYDRKLLGKPCRTINQSLLKFFRTATGLKSGARGAVMAIQTFGDYSRWHPHDHVLLADGLFRESGVFYVMPKVDLAPLAELFRAKVLALLKKEGRSKPTHRRGGSGVRVRLPPPQDSVPDLAGVHQIGLGDRSACLPQMRRGDEDHPLHHRGGDHPPDSGASGIMDEQEAKAGGAGQPRPAGP